jgi:hypothetical protein
VAPIDVLVDERDGIELEAPLRVAGQGLVVDAGHRLYS